MCAGLANPAPIIQTFYAEDQVFNDVKLDGVVTLVDAKHAALHLDEVKPKGIVNEAVEQIAYADRIIVNKVCMIIFVLLMHSFYTVWLLYSFCILDLELSHLKLRLFYFFIIYYKFN